MQQPLPGAAAALAQAAGERRRVAGAGLQELVLLEEADDVLDVLRVHLQRGVAADRRRDGRGLAQVPAAEHLEGRPVDLEELVAHRVVQGVAGLSVGQDGAGQQGEFLAQGWQRHHTPSAWRIVASGRRSTQ